MEYLSCQVNSQSKEMASEDLSEIQKFYTGQTVLITGATGFFGKVIIEKILRTCPNVKRLFLLIRTKKGKQSKDRIEDIFNDPVFERLKKENPNYLSKIVVIAGDVAKPGLDISESDRKRLISEVTLIFHGAATVRFDEKLKTAIIINICGTEELLKLSVDIVNLEAFVHISTAYSNCINQEIKEAVYKPPMPVDEVLTLAKKLTEDTLESCVPIFTEGWPNTYVFTKQIAEDLVKTEAYRNRLPIAILRPAIITSSYKEPIPGWIDNLYGPTGITVAVSAGLLRVVHSKIYLRAELVPIDMVVNAALVIAWDLASNHRNGEINSSMPNELVPVYNYVSSKENPLSWGSYMEYIKKYGLEYPSTRAVWYYSVTVTENLWLFYFLHFLLHMLPAFFIDCFLFIAAKKPQALKLYRKIYKFLRLISYFSTKEWDFHNDNVKNLWTKLSDKDKMLFNFDMDALDWNDYYKSYLKAINVFIFKETPDKLPAARKRYAKLYLLHRLVQIIFFSTIIWVCWSVTTSVINSSQ